MSATNFQSEPQYHLYIWDTQMHNSCLQGQSMFKVKQNAQNSHQSTTLTQLLVVPNKWTHTLIKHLFIPRRSNQVD